MPSREHWLDVARKVDWEYRYVEEQEVFPPAISGKPWFVHAAWAEWNEVYRTTYREYVANQRAKDDSVMGVRSVLTKAHVRQELDLGWLQLVKFHNALFALSEYAAAVGELRMARFGRDSAWRTMATLGALDELRHTQIPLLLGHDLLRIDGNFDWTHRAYHTTDWVMIVARHLFDDMILAADAIEVAVQLNFVFETGFTNLQFMAMAAMADGVHDHLFEKALTSIQTDEARHAQIGHPVLRTLIDNGEAQRAQYLVDKMWWRSWRVLIALTGTSMEYLTPVGVRTKSFRQFMEEWIIEQFIKNLAEFGLERPWFWELFLEELDYAHHSLQLGLYAYRPTLWFDVAMPDAEERLWLASAIRNGRRHSARSGTMLTEVGRRKANPKLSAMRCQLYATYASYLPYSSDPARTPPAPRRPAAGVTSSVPNPVAGCFCRSWIVSVRTGVWSTELSQVSHRPGSQTYFAG